MKITTYSALIITLLFSAGDHSPAHAAEPAASPTTFWDFLGIPQNVQKIRDAVVNRSGKRPQWERKPPLKSIADPANLKSENPAIKLAAQIKAEQDQTEQKVKAIKYLATVGCGCYPGVKEALLAALEECAEEVRYEAAIAFCQAAGNPRVACSKGCCNAEVMTKLREKAYGKDERGCYLESSARVRAAAANALKACERMHPARVGPADREIPVETPVPEVPVETPLDDTGLRGIEQPAPEKAKRPSSDAGGGTSTIVNPISWRPDSGAGEAEAVDESLTACASRYWPRCGPRGYPYEGDPACIGPEGVAVPPDLGGAPPGELAPSDVAPGEVAPGEEALDQPYAPSPGLLASSFGAASGPQSIAPNMIGDFFGGGSTRSTVVRSFTFTDLGGQWPVPGEFLTILPDGTVVARNSDAGWPGPYQILEVNDATGRLGGAPLTEVPAGGTFVDGTTTQRTLPNELTVYDSQFDVAYVVDVPSPGAGGVVGRMKIAENTSPMPRDRLLFNYSYFDSVPLVAGGIGVHRFTPGFEKTFSRGWASFEMKLPMAVTLDSHLLQDGGTDLSHGEFGNIGLTFKRLIMLRRSWALSGGMTVALPTADDMNVALADGTPLVQIKNESVHLQPFFGALWTPNDRFYAQGFLQWDVPANGDPVLINQGNGLLYAGRLNDTTFQYFDVGLGWWAYRGSGRYRRLTGLAYTAEFHWNQSLRHTDAVRAGAFRVGDFSRNLEIFNLTVGAHLELYNKTTVSLGYAIPLGGGLDRQFDGEFRLLVNRRFGPQTRLTRTPPTF